MVLAVACNPETHMHTGGKFANTHLPSVRSVPIVHLAPRRRLARWCAFGMLCAVIGAACLAERLPLLPG